MCLYRDTYHSGWYLLLPHLRTTKLSVAGATKRKAEWHPLQPAPARGTPQVQRLLLRNCVSRRRLTGSGSRLGVTVLFWWGGAEATHDGEVALVSIQSAISHVDELGGVSSVTQTTGTNRRYRRCQIKGMGRLPKALFPADSNGAGAPERGKLRSWIVGVLWLPPCQQVGETELSEIFDCLYEVS